MNVLTKSNGIKQGGNVYQTLYQEVLDGFLKDKGLEFKSALQKKDIRFQKVVLKVFRPDYKSCERMFKLGFQVKTVMRAMRIEAHYEAYEYTGTEKYNSIVFEAIFKEVFPLSVWYCKKNNISHIPDFSYKNNLYYEWFDKIVQEVQDLATQLVYRPDWFFDKELTIYELFRARAYRTANKVIEYYGAHMRDHKYMYNCQLAKYDITAIDNNENRHICIS